MHNSLSLFILSLSLSASLAGPHMSHSFNRHSVIHYRKKIYFWLCEAPVLNIGSVCMRYYDGERYLAVEQRQGYWPWVMYRPLLWPAHVVYMTFNVTGVRSRRSWCATQKQCYQSGTTFEKLEEANTMQILLLHKIRNITAQKIRGLKTKEDDW